MSTAKTWFVPTHFGKPVFVDILSKVADLGYTGHNNYVEAFTTTLTVPDLFFHLSRRLLLALPPTPLTFVLLPSIEVCCHHTFSQSLISSTAVMILKTFFNPVHKILFVILNLLNSNKLEFKLGDDIFRYKAFSSISWERPCIFVLNLSS